MSKTNHIRSGCRDVFHSYLVKNATYAGKLEIPCIEPEHKLPTRLLPFSKAMSSSDYASWIHCYEDDVQFERLWNHPRRYLPILQRFEGMISPDFSLYRDMPLVMQQWNTYRGRAIGHWLQEQGIPIIPNIRFSDERSYTFCCDGISPYCPIAIGSHGCIRIAHEKEYFIQGLEYVVHELHPSTIIVYGSAPEAIFQKYKMQGIQIIQFPSAFSESRKKVHA